MFLSHYATFLIISCSHNFGTMFVYIVYGAKADVLKVGYDAQEGRSYNF